MLLHCNIYAIVFVLFRLLSELTPTIYNKVGSKQECKIKDSVFSHPYVMRTLID